METKQSRWKSLPLWLGMAGGVKLILDAAGVKIEDGLWNSVINTLATMLVMFGVLNNPTNATGF